MTGWLEPAACARAALLADSFRRVTGRDLVPQGGDAAAALWALPQPLVSHGVEADPVFCYANRAALDLWEMDWDRFTRLPSRLSAAADTATQADRNRYLAAAAAQGHVSDYAGIRVAASGARFRIARTVLWTVTDGTGRVHGQAALIGQVTPLPAPQTPK